MTSAPLGRTYIPPCKSLYMTDPPSFKISLMVVTVYWVTSHPLSLAHKDCCDLPTVPHGCEVPWQLNNMTGEKREGSGTGEESN